MSFFLSFIFLFFVWGGGVDKGVMLRPFLLSSSSFRALPASVLANPLIRPPIKTKKEQREKKKKKKNKFNPTKSNNHINCAKTLSSMGDL